MDDARLGAPDLWGAAAAVIDDAVDQGYLTEPPGGG